MRRITGDKGGVLDSVGRCVFACAGDARLADFNPCDALEHSGRPQGEQPAPAIGVDEIPRAGGRRLQADVFDERGEDEWVVLEEIAREKMKPKLL